MTEGKKSIEELLGEAEELLRKDIDKELDIMRRNRWSFYLVNEEKYTEAKKLFEQVLALDPANEKAHKGLAICEYMLTPYIPTQYMMPPEWIDQPREEPKTPWELLGKYKEDDERGMRFTGEEYSKDEEEAQKEAQKMMEEAKKKVEDGAPPMVVYRETEKRFRDMQERLHHGWKGHGPEILEQSLEALMEALGVEQQIYDMDREEVQKEAQKMIEEAKKKVEDGDSPWYVYRETEERLRDMQERLRYRKGHGPEILESSLKALRKACGAVEP